MLSWMCFNCDSSGDEKWLFSQNHTTEDEVKRQDDSRSRHFSKRGGKLSCACVWALPASILIFLDISVYI